MVGMVNRFHHFRFWGWRWSRVCLHRRGILNSFSLSARAVQDAIGGILNAQMSGTSSPHKTPPKHQKTLFWYEKRSDNHFSHMNIDENTTPDRFEALPGLLDHLNDEF